ncbi:MAG: putative bifunctional diguanylate cyclase/phosphodiesterase [Pedobacter sp.]
MIPVDQKRPHLIQIVDDDPAMRLLTRATLEYAGFAVIEAEDGAVGLSQFRKTRPDLVLLDVVMPRMDGFTTCRRLRSLPEGKETPIIMLTGLDDVESVKKAFDAGATDFISKPINWLLLRYRVMYMLRSACLYEDLKISQARLSLAQRIARMGHWHFNFDSEHFACSGEVHTLLGIAEDAPLDSPEGLLQNIHPEDRQRVQDTFHQAIRTRQPYRQNYRVTVDGEERYINSQIEIQTTCDRVPCSMTGIIQDVTAIHHAEQKIFRLAHFDALTGLAKRSFFMDSLSSAMLQAKHAHGQLAVLLLDLDRFKRINETLGHVIGDKVLMSIANRIRRSLQGCKVLYPSSSVADYCVARFGGNEFAILLPDTYGAEQVSQIAGHLIQDISQPFLLGNCEVLITTSIGISLFPQGDDEQESVLRNANTALRHAKAEGRATYRIYQPSMGTPIQDRLILENDLRKALKNDELVLYFQPQVDMRSGQLSGAEVLIRWQHPRQGIKMPGDFLPLAEESGLMIDVDLWVLRQACLQIAKWQASGFATLRLSVNVSGQLFSQDNIADLIGDIVHHYGISASNLEIELTESTIMQNNDKTVSNMSRLKQMGFHIAIDDFGTGYSSLSYLKHFPIDTLKIDRSFIRDLANSPSDMAITRAIIALGDSLGLTTICEGIETPEQKTLLLDLECHYGQGYLFGRPVNINDFTQCLKAQKIEALSFEAGQDCSTNHAEKGFMNYTLIG